ncbi:nSTAND3 domain-containing NTPase [Leuconostoc mesenteroides]|uniref:nSTAND3 domain-containing NTPase n=1 Tax=Leuconostoc mesenteroides TaxID=1245 RepID=UPI0021A69DFC|nr:restriction endonuclease [Leuconostoc mesenteroides]MCT3045568.1 restriction endonuclease [Leuconostoc mesenteroides]
MDIGIRADGLTTTDFENFAIELTKIVFHSEEFHGFKEGRDEGIDGIDNSLSPTLILQAKRWSLNKNSKSAIDLIKKDIDKIYKKKQKEGWYSTFKYVFVTSMDFSHNQLNEIREYANIKLPGSMPSDDYVIFGSKLNILAHDDNCIPVFENYGLLQKDLSKVLSENRIKAIETESKNFFLDIDPCYIVETEFIDKAYHILKETHIILVQGPAGIGKTTTCILLGNLFINNSETDISLINRKIEDIDKIIEMYNTDFKNNYKKSLFVVLDDFLGKNFFDVGERRLMDIQKLYSAAKYSHNLFICLNSRTQILSEAKILNYDFKKLIKKSFDSNNNIVIDLSKYSDIDKATILRKQFELKYHNLSLINKNQLSRRYDELRNSNYLEIIRHRNYYPRLIELIVDNFLLASDNFFKYIIDQLNNPSKIYEELFEHLKHEEQKLLVSILMFHKRPVATNKVISSLKSLNIDQSFYVERSMEKLEGSWITFSSNNLSDQRSVDFLNPSIIDFFNSNLSHINSLKKQVFDNSIFISQTIPSYKGTSFNINNVTITDEKFYNNILSKYDFFVDKEDYIGEMIVAVLKTNKYSQFKSYLLKHLNTYRGDWNSAQYQCGWENVVDAIYYTDALEVKTFFLDLLNDKKYVQRILIGNNVDLDTLNNIVDSIKNILYDIQYDLVSYPKSFFELSNYKLFEERIMKLIQEKLDDYNTVEYYDINDMKKNDFEDKVFNSVINSVSLREVILNKNNFDLSTLQNNIDDYSENSEFDSSWYAKNNSYKIKNDQTIHEIINRPL